MSEIENTIGWGQGSVNNTIGWGQAQEAWCEPPLPSEPATVKNSDESYSNTVACGRILNLPDITVTDSDGSTYTKPSVQDIVCTPSVAPVGATLMKTGQTTSYRTGDDGDLEAGRATNFFTLASNNPFGNTNRFTDELGGQTYTNNIVIDWSTYNGSNVLGYSRNVNAATTWYSNIDNALSYSIGSFTSGWRLPNMTEMFNIVSINNSFTPSLNYSPFNISQTGYFCTSSSYRVAALSSTYCYMLNNVTGQFDPNANANNSYSIYIRTFTVTGTTLT